MTFELYFDLTWNESRMLINESATEWEVDDSVMGSTNFIKSLWLPDIQILNLKQFQKRQIVTDVAGLIIFKDKKVLYTISTEAIISCPMKFSAYPLDHQVKNLILDMLWFHEFSDDFFWSESSNFFPLLFTLHPRSVTSVFRTLKSVFMCIKKENQIFISIFKADFFDTLWL